MSDKNEQPQAAAKKGFTKAQILASRQFTAISKEVIAVVLEDHQVYTIQEVKRLTDAWLKKEAR